MLGRALVAGAVVVIATASARAQSPVGQPAAGNPSASHDSLGTVPDSARAAVRDSSRHEPVERRFDQPHWVMLRSLVVPGWGQMTNGSWTKALLLGGGEVGLGLAAVADNRKLNDLRARINTGTGDADTQNALIDTYNNRLNSLTQHEWLLGGMVVYALVDAYVDAHFRHFRTEFENDRALPGGHPAGAGARLSLEWTF